MAPREHTPWKSTAPAISAQLVVSSALASTPEARYFRGVPFAVGCLALIFPRFALLLVWLLGGTYLARAYEHWVWPLLGFLFLPLTTLTFAFAFNSVGAPGQVTPLGWLLTALAVLGDLGLLSGGRKARKRRDRDE